MRRPQRYELQEDGLPLDVVLSQEAEAMAAAQALRNEQEDAELYESAFGAPPDTDMESPPAPPSQQVAARMPAVQQGDEEEERSPRSPHRSKAVGGCVMFSSIDGAQSQPFCHVCCARSQVIHTKG
jgi:hypothetical protein